MSIAHIFAPITIDGHNTLTLLREPCYEALKRGAKLRRIELSEQPAEGVVAGDAVGQPQKAAQEGLFRLGEFGHVDGALAATQDGAKSDHEKLMKIMQTRIPAERIVQTFPAGGKRFHAVPTTVVLDPPGNPSSPRGASAFIRRAEFQMRFPWVRVSRTVFIGRLSIFDEFRHSLRKWLVIRSRQATALLSEIRSESQKKGIAAWHGAQGLGPGRSPTACA